MVNKTILILAAIFLITIVISVPVGYFLSFQPTDIAVGRSSEDQALPLILPDLQTSEPRELFISRGANSRKIRFSTSTFNRGPGELRILGESDPIEMVTKATQIIKQKDGKEFRKEIGEFVFHPGHEHWHIENFTQFQLWSIEESGEPDKIIATTEKMSYCLWDQEKIDNEESSPETGQFSGNCEEEIQGMSSGWSDTYSAELIGQELDIASVKDGNYVIKSIINLDKKILESNYENNSITAYVEIKNNSIRLIDKP